jgi:hypothetical protein
MHGVLLILLILLVCPCLLRAIGQAIGCLFWGLLILIVVGMLCAH